ncbi:uncharacterized protein KY384_002864 [Bacidia gigantensis]|uniref:uncharacterized protein n=1 Tax=Bacidia gigantensis TaxID=2732470 RepID=UPI001D04D70A|nr:uncharacterized protein KY384_002864 [Bacidia gigantensis]KAG8532379.1 hypothetical protein KY384_002864 [Bacidia gigantensis]
MASTKATIRFIELHHVAYLNVRVEKAASKMLNPTLVQSALDSPSNQNRYGGVKDLSHLSAALGYKLIKNHGFANGNKRTAALAVHLFLLQNGKRVQNNPFDVEENLDIKNAHAMVAEGNMTEAKLASVYGIAWQNATEEDYKDAANLGQGEVEKASEGRSPAEQ